MFIERLENGLLFRTLRDEADIERYVAFNSNYNNINEGNNTNCLIRHYPGARYEDYQLIEDEATGQIVSTTCLIPWQFSFAGVTLRAAQLEQVLSHPEYRHHGLVKIQIKRFMQIVRERQFDLSFIWGIPYYYRQYGYTYCLEGNTIESLPAWRIPDTAQAGDGPFTIRPAALTDVDRLTELYQQAMQPLQIHILRDAEYWRYLLEWARFQVFLVEDRASQCPVGYVGLHPAGRSQQVTVVESGLSNQAAALAVLHWLKARGAQEIRVSWPKESPLAGLARVFGSLTMPGGQWLIHITDPAGFLSKLGPVLEQRLRCSDCAGVTRDLVINLFRQAYRLSFEMGEFKGVKSLGFVDSSMGADGGDLCIPPEAFVRLVFGFRGLDELLDAWPDIVVKVESRPLLDSLFPRLPAYLYATYKSFA